jgi:hypothetical protein
MLGSRLMARRETLDLVIGVRIPAPQPAMNDRARMGGAVFFLAIKILKGGKYEIRKMYYHGAF